VQQKRFAIHRVPSTLVLGKWIMSELAQKRYSDHAAMRNSGAIAAAQ